MTEMEALFESGRAAWMRNDLATAETDLRGALALAPVNPAVRAALGAVLLKTGRLAEGFDLFDAWREIHEQQGVAAPLLPFPLWRGQPVDGRRVLIWSEHGFGDQIMYARFARELVKRGAIVSWLCPRPLARLFAEGLGITVLPSDESVDLNCDVYCPSSALPRAFALTPQTIPPAPYLTAPAPRPVGAKLGVMAAGNLGNSQGESRVLSPDQMARLRALPGAVDLAPEATGAADFHDTAAIIAGLDLVISVDTAVAHLAGALGKPVWVLVPYVSDWRWPPGDGPNPWYASARVFRQGADQDWTAVLDEVERALGAATA